MLVDPSFLDTIQRRQTIMTDPKLNLLVDLDREMEQILQSRTSNVYDKLKSYNATLQRYLQIVGAAVTPIQSSTQTPAEQATTVKTPDSTIQLTQSLATESHDPVQADQIADHHSLHESLLKRLQPAHRMEARRLLNALRLADTNVEWDDSGGNVRVANRPIRYANVISWLNYALKKRPTSAPPNAVNSFIRLLSNSGLDVALYNSKRKAASGG